MSEHKHDWWHNGFDYEDGAWCKVEGCKEWLGCDEITRRLNVVEQLEADNERLKESGIAMVKSTEQIRADRTALQERVKFLEEKVADYKDRLKAALMKPQWDRRQK
jgi:FtsZ-binding cell division protein ZapB